MSMTKIPSLNPPIQIHPIRVGKVLVTGIANGNGPEWEKPMSLSRLGFPDARVAVARFSPPRRTTSERSFSPASPPWADGTRSIDLAPQALLSRMAALVPPPKRHVTVYAGVLASNSPWRRLIIPKPLVGMATESPLQEDAEVSGLSAKPGPGPSGVVEMKPNPGGRRYIP